MRTDKMFFVQKKQKYHLLETKNKCTDYLIADQGVEGLNSSSATTFVDIDNSTDASRVLISCWHWW